MNGILFHQNKVIKKLNCGLINFEKWQICVQSVHRLIKYNRITSITKKQSQKPCKIMEDKKSGENKDLDKYIKFLVFKTSQIIVQSRLGGLVQTKCNKAGTDWVS